MKKNIFTITLLFCLYLPTLVSAQGSFAPIGAEWWYNGNNLDYVFYQPSGFVNETWTDHVVVMGDTTIQGIDCRKVVATRTKKMGLKPDSSFVALSGEGYYYDNADTVFYFNGGTNNFEPLYILNAIDGDTVCLKNPYAGSFSDSTFCYVIDSVRMAVYDTTHLKTFYTRTLIGNGAIRSVNWGVGRYDPGTAKWINTGQYTEKLGGTFGKTGGFFPAMTFHNPDGDVTITFPSGYLTCYTDPVTHIKRTSGACDVLKNPYSSIVSVSQSSYGLTVYPNPSNGAFTLSTQKPLRAVLTIQVTDLSGRKMASLSLEAGKTVLKADLKGLSSGTYLLLLETEGERYYQKLVISH